MQGCTTRAAPNVLLFAGAHNNVNNINFEMTQSRSQQGQSSATRLDVSERDVLNVGHTLAA
jgi:hypothetical protein